MTKPNFGWHLTLPQGRFMYILNYKKNGKFTKKYYQIRKLFFLFFTLYEEKMLTDIGPQFKVEIEDGCVALKNL